jgi:hypothetical protein
MTDSSFKSLRDLDDTADDFLSISLKLQIPGLAFFSFLGYKLTRIPTACL